MDLRDELGLEQERSGVSERGPERSPTSLHHHHPHYGHDGEHKAEVEEPKFVVLESGRIRFFARPRVGIRTLTSLSDVQRFVFTLAPRSRSIVRRIAVGRKCMPDDRIRERQWAYVDRIGSKEDVTADLRAMTYTTKTRGVRHQAEAVELARGTYGITAHRDHSHLLYELEPGEGRVARAVLRQLRIVPRASYIAAVLNPDATWRAPRTRGREALTRPADEEQGPPFSEPSLYDDQLTERFGKRRFAPLVPALLDHEGTELVLIGGGDGRLLPPHAES
jgi:hypothetical protein